jgi:hypothetical protein
LPPDELPLLADEAEDAEDADDALLDDVDTLPLDDDVLEIWAPPVLLDDPPVEVDPPLDVDEITMLPLDPPLPPKPPPKPPPNPPPKNPPPPPITGALPAPPPPI